MTGDKSSSLTEDEIKLYDRQLRLWGLEAQTRLRNSNILLINLTSVGVEITKNLMLGGIGSLTVIDNSTILDQDLNANFFIEPNQVGQNKIESATNKIADMNPRVNLNIDVEDWELKNNDFFEQFTLIIATGLDKSQLIKLNQITRDYNIPLYSTSTHGLYGYIFVDLIEHESTKKFENNMSTKKLGKLNNYNEIININESIENDITYQNCLFKNTYNEFRDIFKNDGESNKFDLSFKKMKKITPILPILLSLLEFKSQINKPIESNDIKFDEFKERIIETTNNLKLPIEIIKDKDELIKAILNQSFCEFQPVSAVLGGALSQDVINMLGKRELPINNFVVLDGINNEMPIFNL